MDEEIARPRNNEIVDLGTFFEFDLDEHESFVKQFVASLEASTTLMTLEFNGRDFEPTPGNNHRVIKPLCRCIANLRRHNQNHPLRKLVIYHLDGPDTDEDFNSILVAAKQYGIHHLKLDNCGLHIQSMVEFCRDNTLLKVLESKIAAFEVKESSISACFCSQDGPPESTSAILALENLAVTRTMFGTPADATKFSNIIAHMTYPVLKLGSISIGEETSDEEKNAQLRIVSELIKPSVDELTLTDCCPIEVMDVIEACATVTQIQLDNDNPPRNFLPDANQEKLQEIATRNRALACFVANPRTYPDDELLKLMRQFDNSPTGRYMLAQSFPGIPFFFKIKSADSSTACTNKEKRSY